MSLPGGIRTRIVIVLVGIVAGALGTAYMIVVPSLERRLVDARLHQLAELGVPLAKTLPEDTLRWQDRVESFGVETNSRVVAFSVLSKTQSSLVVVADSRTKSSRDVQRDPIARAAMTSGDVEQGRVAGSNGGYAEVAVPAGPETILLFQVALADSLATVEIVRERLLLATAFALALALILVLTAAGMLAHRLVRLETAAERIAGGDFGAPIVDHGNDEIGELARAFDRMRVQLAQLDNARKEFVANASHELRTPLFSLAGFLELLDDEDLDEGTRREFLATTRSQVDRLTKLATDLLDLSRMDVGRMRIDRDEVGLAEVARVVAEDFFALADASDHVLLLEVDGDAWAHADEERVQQIARALVGNALVHTPGGTTVQLRVERRGARVALVVADDGPGIPPEHLERVFQRFYRVEGGQASGSGLGLAIARELAELMGGTVTVASRTGATAFTLELPAESPPVRVAEALPR